jgi:hypothetical protein
MATRHRAFELFLRAAHPVLVERDGADFADDVIDAARSEYHLVLPEVPDIGGARNAFQPVMTVNGWLVALHRALAARGRKASESIAVSQEVFDRWLRKLPDFALRGIGRLLLSPPVRAYFERQAARSQERRYAEDFVWRVERADDGEVSFIFDECAVNKWYDAQGLRELKPYCNFVDVTYSRLMGMGIDASETIGLGCPQCTLRYKHGRETLVPPSLEGIVRS